MYTGYQTIYGDTNDINCIMSDPDFSNGFAVNEYLIIINKDDGSIKEMRFDGAGFVPLRLPPAKIIKAKNALQRCALDLLNNSDVPVVCILGNFGSGKTFLAMRMALYHVREKGSQAKILGIRSPWGEGRDIGWLPGDFEDKTGAFFLPLVQQLDNGEFELERLKQLGMLESNIPKFLKGTTYNETIMLVDEAEDLTEKEVRLIGTRLGQNSRVIFSGDIKQSLLRTDEKNPMIKMCEALRGNRMFGCIYLEEDVRSEASKLFATLFEDE